MKNTKFNWKCVYCGKQNMEIIKFQFDVPKYYEANWECSNCKKTTVIGITLTIDRYKSERENE